MQHSTDSIAASRDQTSPDAVNHVFREPTFDLDAVRLIALDAASVAVTAAEYSRRFFPRASTGRMA